MRSFGQIQELLVASPGYLDRAGRPTDPDQLRDHVTLTMSEDEVRQRWELQGSDGEVRRIDLKPRVSGFDFPMLMALAKQGLGITMLPRSEEHTSELQSLMRNSYAVFCLTKKIKITAA